MDEPSQFSLDQSLTTYRVGLLSENATIMLLKRDVCCTSWTFELKKFPHSKLKVSPPSFKTLFFQLTYSCSSRRTTPSTTCTGWRSAWTTCTTAPTTASSTGAATARSRRPSCRRPSSASAGRRFVLTAYSYRAIHQVREDLLLTWLEIMSCNWV